MSQMKYKLVTREGSGLYNRYRYVRIPEGIKTIEEIENYIRQQHCYAFRSEFKFDHSKRAYKVRGY